MTITKFRIGMVALLVLGIAALFAIVGKAQGPTLPPGSYDLEAGEYIFNVPELEETPVPPTDTPVPPTDTPVPGGEPFVGAPSCPSHDSTGWHGLWDYGRGCHYNHEHGENPFDPEIVAWIGDYTIFTGQEISYAWQTWAGVEAGVPPAPGIMENDIKHEGYKIDWIVFPDCRTAGWADHGVKAFLIERHSLSTERAARGRIHSFFAMAVPCNTETQENYDLFVFSGHVDYGQLQERNITVIALDNSPQPAYGLRRQPYRWHDCYRDSGDICGAMPDPTAKNKESRIIWNCHVAPLAEGIVDGHEIGCFAFRVRDGFEMMRGSTLFDGEGVVFDIICGDPYDPILCEFNGSQRSTYGMQFRAPAGLSDFDGFTDVAGNIDSSCTTPSSTCAPLFFSNAPEGWIEWDINIFPDLGLPGFNVGPDKGLQEFDFYFCDDVLCAWDDSGAIPSGWIEYPN